MTSCGLIGSPKRAIAMTAPRNGASEKYAPVRALPRWRSARTNRTRLKPTPQIQPRLRRPIRRIGGISAGRNKAIIRFTLPAATPLVSAMTTGVHGRELPREVVVNSPCKAGSGHRQAAFVEANSLTLPGQRDRARKDPLGAKRRSQVDILQKDDPGDRHGRLSFEIEEQRAGRGGRAGEPEHQEGRDPRIPPNATIAIIQGASGAVTAPPGFERRGWSATPGRS